MKVGLGVLAVVMVMVATLVLLKTPLIPISPAGKYREDRVACEGAAYYDFSDGKVVLVVPTGSEGRDDGRKERYLGTYVKTAGTWHVLTTDGSSFPIKTTPLAIEWKEPNGKTVRFPRLFLKPSRPKKPSD